jgi:glucuronate isomerase
MDDRLLKTPFMNEDFLLQTRTARELYHRFAAPMPIIDYHGHLPPGEIADDRRWENLTQIWLAGDHYKWRAMRTNGIPERFITGAAPDWEKFLKWAETVPAALRNPLYHWTHLELKKPFGITDKLLNAGTAREIWDSCNARLREPAFSCRGILRQWDVRVVCTTDDPADDLRHHERIAGDGSGIVRVSPTFRPDKALLPAPAPAFNAWLDRLGAAAGIEIRTYGGLLEALRKRADYFHARGCRLSDHGLEQVPADDFTERAAAEVFARARSGESVSPADARVYASALLVELGLLYHEKGWTQQFHLGALRGTNTRMLTALGADTGHDTIGDFEMGRPLARFLDRLDRDDRLARTILYNLNPRDNELMAAMIGNFQDGTMPGKIQYGSAWWFLDQKDGMEQQLDALSNMGLLSRFVGMLTDSRSFLSFSRHEYFRRILCNLLGREIEEGLLPNDLPLVGGVVQDICYRNAAAYFGFDLGPA